MAFFKQGGELVGEVFQFFAGQFLVDQSFHSLHVGQLLRDKEGQRVALLGGTTRPADAVHVVFRVLGHVVVDDMGNAGDIETAGGDVRGH